MSIDFHAGVYLTPENAKSHNSGMDYLGLLRSITSAAKIKQEGLGTLLGVSQPTVSRWFSGDAKPGVDSREKIMAAARRFGLVQESAVFDAAMPDERPNRPTVKVVGYVGAGEIAHFYAVAQGELDEATVPEGATPETVAVEIRGNSLGELFDRWLIFYDEVRRPVSSDLLGRLCVVGLPDERVLVKKIRRGQNGLFDLHSNTEEPIRNVAVEWAARVRQMVPR
jgi:transcriptional regulator with XRE-family HTH domain